MRANFMDRERIVQAFFFLFLRWLLIPEEAAPQFLDDAAPRNGMMPPPDSWMIAPPITE